MGNFNALELSGLVNKFKSMPELVNTVSANVINRSTTFAMDKSIGEIIREYTLKESYVRSKFKRVGRASKSNLRSIVRVSDRRTLLNRFRHAKTSNGVSVTIKRGVTKKIKRGFIVTNLKGSGTSGVAVMNLDRLNYLKTSTHKSDRRPQALSYMTGEFKKKPKGWTVLNTTSINNMFESKREDIKPILSVFMKKEFFKEFKSKL